jgi:hypothetical protein
MIRPDPDQRLGDGDHRGAVGRRKSPHDELQTYLNANTDVQWSVVSDGLTLRVLRDYYHTYARGYVEFDLESIFTNRSYADFRALYRLVHASRFIRGDSEESPLEQLYQVAVATGVKVGEDLQSNVVDALETLGNGLLTPEIREALEEGGQGAADRYYQDLLRVVYRLLFLMFAEQRGMMADRGDLYTEEYSISTLRRRSEEKIGHDQNTDLWEGLQVTFDLVGNGVDEDGLYVPAYNGGLFDDERIEFATDASCPNSALLEAIYDLTHIEQEDYQQRISYADLGVDEIGAVYESLLEFTPRYAETPIKDQDVAAGDFFLDDRGIERKDTGSYYTKPELVNELINSSLEPVVDKRVDQEASVESQEKSLLSIDVCDPACGSGAFLIAANDYLGKKLAEIRTQSDYPGEEALREARRDVVQHCLYGVDVNPMAVELAKVSLWINSAVEDEPLNFLDHKIRCGNSLLGTTQKLVDAGLPDDAYETSGGRDWHPGNEVRKRVRNENKDRQQGQNESLNRWNSGKDTVIQLAQEIDEIDETDKQSVERKAELNEKLRNRPELQNKQLVFDAWTAAFFWPMDADTPEYPTPSTIEKLRRNPEPSDESLQGMIDIVEQLAEKHSFFHWRLEFPLVFANGETGFDCILTNPPWDKVKPQPKEWFEGKHEKIADAKKRKRTRLINKLEETNPSLYQEWITTKEDSERKARFMQESGRFEKSATGDLNTYPIFAELTSEELLDKSGRTGIILKTGIGTDKENEKIFGHLVSQDKIISFYDFRNSELLFPDVHQNERFCLLTIGDKPSGDAIDFSFLNTTVDELHDESRHMSLTSAEIKSINPNTKTVPTFRNIRDKELTIGIHSQFPVLVNLEEGTNPWGITYYQMFHMTNDSDVFEDNTLDELESQGYQLNSSAEFVSNSASGDGDVEYLPLYEGKHFHQYDHRLNTYDHSQGDDDPEIRNVTTQEKSDLDFEPLPEHWVAIDEFEDEVEDQPWNQDWVFAFRDIADATTNYRTSIGTIIPFIPFGNTASLLLFEEESAEKASLFTSIFNSFTFDFALRQSIGGTHVNKYILEQLPMPEPGSIGEYCVTEGGSGYSSLENYLTERVAKLTWTSHSIDEFGAEFDTISGPVNWKNIDRLTLQAEIDAAVAKLFDINKDDYEYILNSYEILKEREQSEYGEYRTRIECTNKFDAVDVVHPDDYSESDQ